jgi:hypothetical protein
MTTGIHRRIFLFVAWHNAYLLLFVLGHLGHLEYLAYLESLSLFARPAGIPVWIAGGWAHARSIRPVNERLRSIVVRQNCKWRATSSFSDW